MFYSNELQRSHSPASKRSLLSFESAGRMRPKRPILTRQNRAICPVANLTQTVKASSNEILIEISKLRV